VAKHNILGKKGEDFAVSYLLEKGYIVLEKNWLQQKFEIDIIAKDGNELVFVEVKTRSTNFFENPEEAVTIKKQQHLIEGADFYLEQNELDIESRFDVIAIIYNKKTLEIKHFKNAFYPRI